LIGDVFRPTDDDGISKHEKRILSCFEPASQLSVKEMDETLEGYMHVNTLRVYLHKLEEGGYLDVKRKGVGAVAYYSLTGDKGIDYYKNRQEPKPSVSLKPRKRKGSK
tara:strand:+ start:6564 stop:6887 length:324 start_codon:yes stop_codon:yes gene_type:complete